VDILKLAGSRDYGGLLESADDILFQELTVCTVGMDTVHFLWQTATNERTNERMNERTNERTTANERTNERTNGGNDCALAATALLRRFDYTLRRSSDRAIKLVLIHWLCVLIGRGSMTVISVGFRFD